MNTLTATLLPLLTSEQAEQIDTLRAALQRAERRRDEAIRLECWSEVKRECGRIVRLHLEIAKVWRGEGEG